MLTVLRSSTPQFSLTANSKRFRVHEDHAERLEANHPSIVTGLLSGSAIVLSYLMTLSALARTFGGIVRSICLAVFRLIKK